MVCRLIKVFVFYLWSKYRAPNHQPRPTIKRSLTDEILKITWCHSHLSCQVTGQGWLFALKRKKVGEKSMIWLHQQVLPAASLFHFESFFRGGVVQQIISPFRKTPKTWKSGPSSKILDSLRISSPYLSYLYTFTSYSSPSKKPQSPPNLHWDNWFHGTIRKWPSLLNGSPAIPHEWQGSHSKHLKSWDVCCGNSS